MNNKIDKKAWEESSEAGLVKQLNVGPQLCRIIKVEDFEEKEYLKIYFDIISGEFKNYFQEIDEKFGTWNNSGVIYRSYKTTAYPYLKAFVIALEKSNPNYSFSSSDYDFQSFTNKQMVVVFGEEEIPYLDDEKRIKISVKPREVRSIQALTEGKIKTPELKKLSEEEKMKLFEELNQTPKPIVTDSDLPF